LNVEWRLTITDWWFKNNAYFAKTLCPLR
jgi:hypothetical protein